VPPLEEILMDQDAVWWAANGLDRNADIKVAAPVAVKCEWIWKTTLLRSSGRGTGAEGQTVTTIATVTVDRDMSLGDLLWFGSINDLPKPPDQPQFVCQVVGLGDTPDVKNRFHVRTVQLMFFKNKIPPIGP
jgi:hypothetical protein